MVSPESLISYYKLDEASGDAIDAHGSNDGTVTGADYGATGKLNDCYDFESTNNDHVSIDDGSSNISTVMSCASGDITVTAWFKTESIGSYPRVFGGAEVYAQSAFIKSDGKLYWGEAGTADATGSTDTFTAGNWTFAAWGFDDSANEIYYWINGSPDSGGAVSWAHTSPTDLSQSIGGYAGAYFDGLIDEVSVWNRLLTDQDISDLYNSGDGLSYDSFAGGAPAMKINIGDTWKEVAAVKVNVGDSWKEVDTVKLNVGDAWKET